MAAEPEIPDRLLPAIRIAVFWVGLPFILLLTATDRYFAGTLYQVIACVFGAFLSIFVAVYWDRIISRTWPRYSHQRELQYFDERDPTLGSAIQVMAQNSAWGRWYAAQHLVNSGVPITEQHLLQTAASIVTDQIVNGGIEVRGRRPERMEYEPIPRTDWRSSALSFVRDPVSLWRLAIFPRGGAEIAPDGTIARASNPAAAQRNSQIAGYDSLIVDARQFENVWPKREGLADRYRRRFLRRARKRKLDRTEIQRLSDSPIWRQSSFWAMSILGIAAVAVLVWAAISSLEKTAVEWMLPLQVAQQCAVTPPTPEKLLRLLREAKVAAQGQEVVLDARGERHTGSLQKIRAGEWQRLSLTDDLSRALSIDGIWTQYVGLEMAIIKPCK